MLWWGHSPSTPRLNRPVGGGGSSNLDLQELKGLVEDAQTAVGPLHADWRTYRDYYGPEGQRAKLESLLRDPDLRKLIVVSNFIFASLETLVSTLMRVVPEWYVVTAAGETDEHAQAVTNYLQAFYQDHKLAADQEQCYRNAGALGTGILKAYWDPGRAEVRLANVDPVTVFPDPTATRIEDCAFVACRNVYGKYLANRLWPDLDLDHAMRVTGAGDTGELETSQVQTGQERIEVWEVYHGFGEQYTVYTGDQVLHTGENPTPSKRYPFFFFTTHQDERSLWGHSTLAYLMGLQDSINKKRTRAEIFLHYTTPPIIKTDDPDYIFDLSASRVLRLHPNMQAEWMVPPPLPPDLLESLGRDQADFDTISGVGDAIRGIRPIGTTSGLMVEALQGASQTRLTSPARNWSYQQAEAGQCVLELMQAHYAEPRSVIGFSAEGPAAVGITPDQLSATGQDEQGKPTTVPYAYRVICREGGDLPQSPAARLQIAQGLRAQRDIDQQAMLEAANFPNWKQVMQRMTAADQAQMQGQAAAMGQQQAGQAPQQAQMPPAESPAGPQGSQGPPPDLTGAPGGGSMGPGGSGDAEMQAQLTQILGPDVMQVVEAVRAGQEDPNRLTQLFEAVPPMVQNMLSVYIGGTEGRAQGQMGPMGG